jgi:hypothetical protein
MDLPDFGELFDPDLDPDFFDKKQWAKVPEPIRKDVTITQAGLGGLPFAQERSIRALFPNMALSDLARRTHDVHSWGAERTSIRAAMRSESDPHRNCAI